MTGLAQKNGAVFSHVRVANSPDALHAQKLGCAETDVLLAFDLVAALSEEASATLATDRSHAVVNSEAVATAAFQFNREALVDSRYLLTRLNKLIGTDAIATVDATHLATALLGDPIGANFLMVGAAAQRGLLPISVEAIERAIKLNGTAVAFNLSALRLGRLFAADAEKVLAMMPSAESEPEVDQSVEMLIVSRTDHLVAYANEAYAERYRALVARVRVAEQRILPESDALTKAVARIYAKFLAYKDEYEVARLLSSPALMADLKNAFADGASYSFNLAPPILAGRHINGRSRKRAFNSKLMRPLLTLLAHMKPLRGTMLDPFGYFSERKRERALIAEYESLVETVLMNLAANNHRHAVTLLELGDMVRGYGPVKEQSMDAYTKALASALKTFLEGDRADIAPDLGSGLIDQSQKMTVAARAMAEKKTVGQRS